MGSSSYIFVSFLFSWFFLGSFFFLFLFAFFSFLLRCFSFFSPPFLSPLAGFVRCNFRSLFWLRLLPLPNPRARYLRTVVVVCVSPLQRKPKQKRERKILKKIYCRREHVKREEKKKQRQHRSSTASAKKKCNGWPLLHGSS